NPRPAAGSPALGFRRHTRVGRGSPHASHAALLGRFNHRERRGRQRLEPQRTQRAQRKNIDLVVVALGSFTPRNQRSAVPLWPLCPLWFNALGSCPLRFILSARSRGQPAGERHSLNFQRPRTPRAMDIEQLTINTIRTLAMDAVQKAESGHPGTPMALAPLAYKLYMQHMKHDPADPKWFDRDRFVLSAGHASMLLYSSLYLSGYGLTLEDLEQFRQWESRTPGHPEYWCAPGV